MPRVVSLDFPVFALLVYVHVKESKAQGTFRAENNACCGRNYI